MLQGDTTRPDDRQPASARRPLPHEPAVIDYEPLVCGGSYMVTPQVRQ